MATASPAPTTRRRRLLWREAIDGYLCILPWLIGFLAFVAGPMLASVFLAFADWSILGAPKLVGLKNFQDILKDDLFWVSLYNTAYYTFVAVPAHIVGALAMAIVLNARISGINIYRTWYYVPSVVPAVANAVLWRWIFATEYGLANDILRLLGMPAPSWLLDPAWAKPALIVMSMWSIGSSMLIFLAGLQGIPETLYEAASIDGAGFWSRFRHVTVPMLTPVIFFNLVMGIIASFQVFTTAYVMTGGGPRNATLFYVLYLYRQAFEFLHMGYASALAWILFVIILAFTFVQLKAASIWVYYEGGLRK